MTGSQRNNVIPIRQIHPRVLVQDKDCVSCKYSDFPVHQDTGDCRLLDIKIWLYDDCTAFERKQNATE